VFRYFGFRNLAIAIFSSFVFFVSSAHAHDFSEPEEAINSYITGVTTGSGEHVEMAFTEAASIQYFNHENVYNNFTRDEFAKLVNNGNKWNANVEITEMKKTGNAANATVEFTWGEQGEHGYVDYINLIFDGKSWHITDKVAQYIKRK